jgi:hypothetical protein
MRSRGTVLLLAGVLLMFGSWIVAKTISPRHAHPPLPAATDPGAATFNLDEMTDAPRTPIQKTITWAAFIGFILFVSGLVSLFGSSVDRHREKRS